MAPIVHGLEIEYFDQIEFTYLDVDDPLSDVFKRELGYRVQPHYFLLDGNGIIIEQWLGSVSSSEFRSAFDSVLNQ